MRFPGQSILVASSHDLVNELCDEKRFPKTLQGLRVCLCRSTYVYKSLTDKYLSIQEMRHGVNDGLLTVSMWVPAETQREENETHISHRLKQRSPIGASRIGS
jgi:hypothetical protein